MKYKGKAISGTSLLTILGVVCFASVIVSAVLITSGTLTFAGTTVTTPGNIALTDSGSDTTSVLAGNSAVYNFNANVGQAVTGATITVTIAKTGISLADITSAKLTYDVGSATDLSSLTDNGDTVTGTYTVGVQAVDATLPCIITIVYAAAGTYVVSAAMSGTA